MSNEKVFQMNLQKVYPLLVAKAEKKGRTRAEVDQVTCWLTGYSQEQLAALLESGIPYGDFFRQAPSPIPTGKRSPGPCAGCAWSPSAIPSCGKSAFWTSWWTSWPRASPWRRCCGNRPRFPPEGKGKNSEKSPSRFFRSVIE